MNSIELFKYSLYQTGTIFNQEELAGRVQSSLNEIMILIPELVESAFLELQHSLEASSDYLFLVLKMHEPVQTNLPFLSNQETLLEIRQRIINRIYSFPILMNSIVLNDSAALVSSNHQLVNEDDRNAELKKFMYKRKSSSQLLKIDDKQQLIDFPDFVEYKIDPKSRQIECKVDELKRLGAIIYGVKDSSVTHEIKLSRKIRLNIRKVNKDIRVQQILSNKMFEANYVSFEVTAILSNLTNEVVEYELISII